VKKNVITVNSAIEFRDAVFSLRKNGSQNIYVQLKDTPAQVYVVIDDLRNFTVQDLFSSNYPPVHMEEFARALLQAVRDGGEAPEVDVFMLA
jgi:hypothetical protein